MGGEAETVIRTKKLVPVKETPVKKAPVQRFALIILVSFLVALGIVAIIELMRRNDTPRSTSLPVNRAEIVPTANAPAPIESTPLPVVKTPKPKPQKTVNEENYSTTNSNTDVVMSNVPYQSNVSRYSNSFSNNIVMGCQLANYGKSLYLREKCGNKDCDNDSSTIAGEFPSGYSVGMTSFRPIASSRGGSWIPIEVSGNILYVYSTKLICAGMNN